MKKFFINSTLTVLTAVSALMFWGFMVNSTPTDKPVDAVSVAPKAIVKQDPQLLALLVSLGATHTDDLNLAYEGITNEKYRGEYLHTDEHENGSIRIRTGLDKNQETSALAHEYLHHVWYKVMPDADRNKLWPQLNIMLENDADMKHRTTSYADTNKLSATELFSIYCTESSDGYISPIVDECNKYIDRSKLVFSR